MTARPASPTRQAVTSRGLAGELDVAKGTVRRALAELRERGLIRTLHGRGSVVL